MSRQQGFTLIELMIVVTVAGLIIGTGIGGWGQLKKSMRQGQAGAQVTQAIRRARQHAVTRHHPVILVFGTAPTTTNITSYTVHMDSDADRVKDAGEVRNNFSLPAGTTLSSVALTPVDSLVFDSSGMLATGGLGGRLIVTGGRGQPDTLLVSPVGMVFEP